MGGLCCRNGSSRRVGILAHRNDSSCRVGFQTTITIESNSGNLKGK
ncbi:MAG: hypothetical protein IJ143_07930 [Neisseriaceae bacterium]|nr:hypothetical protein [Neisseriaceae bacterium]